MLNEENATVQTATEVALMPKVKIAVGILLGLLFLSIIQSRGISSESAPEPSQEPIPQDEIEIAETPKKPVEKLTEAQKRQKLIEDNPHNCDTATQWIVWPDGHCSNKEVAQTVKAPTGSWVDRCYRWAEMAGIPFNATAIKIIEKESHCNPTARNPSSSAGGIPQALPWTKMGCGLSWSDKDAVCQMKWFWSYVKARYGSYEAAWAFHLQNNWY